MSVPEICGDCRNDAQSEAVTLYDKMEKAKGTKLLTQAKNAWALSPNPEGARKAMEYIDSIPIETEAYASAEELVTTIQKQLSSDKEREWQQRIKEYNDDLQLRRTRNSRHHQEKMASIAAARSVAEKWAENQPQTKVYLNW